MAYDPFQPIGQTIMASSLGVTIASDQSPVSVTGIVSVSNPQSSVIAIINSIPSVATNVQGSIATVIIGGSIIANFTPPANQSVSGTVGASILGLTPVAVTNTPSISGTVNIGNQIGSVVAFQGTIPWVIGSIYGNISGSVAATISGNPSVSGTVGASIIGSVPISNFPANQSVSGTVGASIIGLTPINIVGAPSIYGNISGSVVAFQGTSPFVVNFQNSSILAVPVGSIISVPTGSVITVNQSSSIITKFSDSSIITKWADSSVLSGQQGTWRVSVAGTYASGAASVVSALGFLHLGVRNDTMASTLASDVQYSPMVVGPVGETITAPAPINKWVSGTASILTVGQSVTAIAAGAAGVYTYVTGIQVTGYSPSSVLLKIQGGATVLATMVVPSGGTTTTSFMPIPMKGAVGGAITASISGSASVWVGVQGFNSTT